MHEEVKSKNDLIEMHEEVKSKNRNFYWAYAPAASENIFLDPLVHAQKSYILLSI